MSSGDLTDVTLRPDTDVPYMIFIPMVVLPLGWCHWGQCNRDVDGNVELHNAICIADDIDDTDSDNRSSAVADCEEDSEHDEDNVYMDIMNIMDNAARVN